MLTNELFYESNCISCWWCFVPVLHCHTVQMDCIKVLKRAKKTPSPKPFNAHTRAHTWPVSCDRGRDNFVTCWAVSPSKRWSQPSALLLFGCPGCGSLRTRPVGKIQVKHAQLSKTHTHEHCSGFQHNWAFCRTFNSSSMIDFNDMS